MAFKTRRQARYAKLREGALLPFEARPLSKVPFKVTPYIKEIITDRYMMYLKAQRMGVKQKDFERQIKELYRLNDWTRKDKLGRVQADPWAMFRGYEDKHKAKFPEYESPWMKRWRNWKDFLRKIERTMAKQRGEA